MAAPQSTLVGTTLAGCRVERDLGAGAQGEVALARHADGRLVVVKVLAADLSEDPELRRRFEREGLALLALPPHPHLVAIESVHADEERPCLLMEFVEGVSLRQRLRTDGTLPARDALTVARQVALGMHCVHAHGLLHRDVKPANVMLSPQGVAKIVDFGVVKDVNQTTMTVDGQLLGTAPFLAPERWRNEPIRKPAEVFALGVLLYELLVGARPFEAPTLPEMARAILRGDYEPASARVEGVAPSVDLLLAQLLATDERYRYEHMADVAEDLARILAGGAPHVPRLVEASSGTVFPLLGRRFLVGRGEGCGVRLDHPSVGERHLQLRQADAGYEARPMRGNPGISLRGAALTGPRILAHGDRLRVGDVELVFEEWKRRPRPDPLALDLERQQWPAPVVQALATLGDPRALASLLERLSPEPLGLLRAEQELALVVAPGAARAAAAAAEAEVERARAGALGSLAQIARWGRGKSDARWLEWWSWARTEQRAQVVTGGDPPAIALEAIAGVEGRFTPGEAGVVAVGRDDSCGVRLEHRTVSRRHATLLRLDQRWIIRDGGKPGGTAVNGARVRAALLNAGDVVELGDVKLAIRPPPLAAPPERGGFHTVNPDCFRGLVHVGDESVALALLRCLDPNPTWAAASRAALFSDPAAAARYTALLAGSLQTRSDWARAALARLLGSDLGADVARWRRALDVRAAQLPSQVAPRGWGLVE